MILIRLRDVDEEVVQLVDWAHFSDLDQSLVGQEAHLAALKIDLALDLAAWLVRCH